MNQYLITAYDYTDTEASDRRMNVRGHHLNEIAKLKENKNYLFGGAILNDDGKMIGSAMIMQFQSEEELNAWKQNEPYVTQKVWETVDVKPFRVAQLPAA